MSSLILYCPNFRLPEREYAARVVFNEFLGLKCLTKTHGMDYWHLSDSEGKRWLLMPDSFFSKSHSDWLTPESLPERPLPIWNVGADLRGALLTHSKLPIIAGQASAEKAWFLRSSNNKARLGLDVLGSAFFMLTRYEEIIKPDLDEHGRFPAMATLSYQERFLERPIIDEYVEVLWVAMKQLWPGIKRYKHQYRLVLTHDVDWPFGVKGEPWKRVVRRFGGDFVHRKMPFLAVQRLGSLLFPGRTGDKMDPNNTFDWIMGQSEKRGLQSEFYFLAGKTSTFDSGYDVFSPCIQRLLQRIHQRGHIIGLHPSYGTLGRPDLLLSEVDKLHKALEKAKVPQQVRSGRQHYLRWQAKRTWADWEEAGLEEDSSVGFSEHVGFRTGTCRRYSTWSWVEGKSLCMIERPLIAMEVSLLSKKYMHVSPVSFIKILNRLAAHAMIFDGEFVVLWHNDSVISLKPLYKKFLEEVL